MVYIKDVTVVLSQDWNVSPPEGYVKLFPNVNVGTSGNVFPFICVKTTLDVDDSLFVTDVVVVGGSDRQVPCPPGYERIDSDLNADAGGEFIYLCKKMERGKPPLEDLVVKAYATAGEYEIDNFNQVGYTRIDYDLNKGAKGSFIFLFKKKSDQRDYCVALLNKGLSSDSCLDAVKHNTVGDYDDYMLRYCSLFEHKDKPECACINSDSVKYRYNPLCIDKRCITDGYVTKSMEKSRGAECQILDCSTYFNIVADGSVQLTDDVVNNSCLQQMSHSTTSVPTPIANTTTPIISNTTTTPLTPTVVVQPTPVVQQSSSSIRLPKDSYFQPLHVLTPSVTPPITPVYSPTTIVQHPTTISQDTSVYVKIALMTSGGLILGIIVAIMVYVTSSLI